MLSAPVDSDAFLFASFATFCWFPLPAKWPSYREPRGSELAPS